jgi:L-lactate dehydrogenase
MLMELHNRKVVIIGAGFVGSSIAYAINLRNLAKEIILIDIDKKKAQGEALDIQHGISYMGRSSVRVGEYSDCSDSDLIIITAGRNRKSNESRLDMVYDNLKIMDNVVEELKKYYTRGVILIVSNPVDILTYYVDKKMGLPNGRVVGTGCILDTSRLIREIANYTGLNSEAIKCNIIGEHGDTQIPVWSRLAIAGVPMDEYCQNVNLIWNDEIRNDIYSKVKTMGTTIIEDKGRTHYGIATCVCQLADAVLNQRLTIASVTTPLTGEYKITNVALSLPSIIGVNGVEHRLVEYLNENEYKALQISAKKMRETLDEIE